jgi:hypothetical protein
MALANRQAGVSVFRALAVVTSHQLRLLKPDEAIENDGSSDYAPHHSPDRILRSVPA